MSWDDAKYRAKYAGFTSSELPVSVGKWDDEAKAEYVGLPVEQLVASYEQAVVIFQSPSSSSLYS
jgi:hypothetical protein